MDPNGVNPHLQQYKLDQNEASSFKRLLKTNSWAENYIWKFQQQLVHLSKQMKGHC